MEWILVICWLKLNPLMPICTQTPMPTEAECIIEMKRTIEEHMNVIATCPPVWKLENGHST